MFTDRRTTDTKRSVKLYIMTSFLCHRETRSVYTTKNLVIIFSHIKSLTFSSLSFTDTVSISNLSTNGSDLYTFMVQNNKLNDLKKFDMIPSIDPEIDNVSTCFAKNV
jgi:hypothetical protein